MAMATERMYIRFAGAADAAELANVRTAALLEMGLLGGGEAPAFARRAEREFQALFRDERLCALVLVADGCIAGSACIVVWDRLPYPGSSRHAELAGVYVAPRYRRRGIARELVGEALAGVNALGVRRIFVAPTAATEPFYRSFGFDDATWLRSPLAG